MTTNRVLRGIFNTHSSLCWSSSSCVAKRVHLKWAMKSLRLVMTTVRWLAMEMYVFSIRIEFLSSRTFASCEAPYRATDISSPSKLRVIIFKYYAYHLSWTSTKNKSNSITLQWVNSWFNWSSFYSFQKSAPDDGNL